MADRSSEIETMEHRFMRAWINGDAKTLKALTARDFVLMIGSKPPVMLDYSSWIEAAGKRWSCSAYRFGSVYVRSHAGLAIFAAEAEFESRIDGLDWSGSVWITDVWRRSKMRRRWRLVERQVSRPESEAKLPGAIRALQLWR
ncbi:MAG: DUF4440 domain-containing protein [Sphingomicrobium sp.]